MKEIVILGQTADRQKDGQRFQQTNRYTFEQKTDRQKDGQMFEKAK